MKKNITSIIIMALVGLNVVLTGIILFAMVPSLNKVNTLVTKVSNAVDLDLGNLVEAEKEELTIEDKENYTLEDKFSGTLKKGNDGKIHYVAIDSVSFTINKKAESYTQVINNIATYQTSINDVVSKTFNSYTMDEVAGKQDEIKQKIIDGVSQLFSNADCFVSVSFSNLRYQ